LLSLLSASIKARYDQASQNTASAVAEIAAAR
jgi:hypothetical protein